MKIYLSKYWIETHILTVCLAAIIVVATTAFCIWSHDKEDYILIIGALFFILLFVCLQLSTRKLLDYVEVRNNQFVMCSVNGKEQCTIHSDDPVYYQIVPLNEGILSKAAFIVLSNQEFAPYPKDCGLIKVHKDIADKGNQIIMPYHQASIPLFCLDKWHAVNDKNLIKSFTEEHIIIRLPKDNLRSGCLVILLFAVLLVMVRTFLPVFFTDASVALWSWIYFSFSILMGVSLVWETMIWKIEVFKQEPYFLLRTAALRTSKIQYCECASFRFSSDSLILKTRRGTFRINCHATNFACLWAMLYQHRVKELQ